MKNYITLKENRDFSRLYHWGKSFVSPVLVTYILKNKSNNLRYGITTGKKIGNAVKRNRAKRVIRAAFMPLVPFIKEGYDFVIVARTRLLTVKSTAVSDSIRGLLEAVEICEKRWASF